jgi:hypothetical protein
VGSRRAERWFQKDGREPRRGPRQATGVGSVEYEVEHKEPRWWWWSTRSRESHRKSRWRLRSNGRTLRKDEVRKSLPSIEGGRSRSRSSRDGHRQVSVEVEIERQDFTERRGEEILAVDRRDREIEIEIEIEPRSRSRWRPRHRKAR